MKIEIRATGIEIAIDGRTIGTVFPNDDEIVFDDALSSEELKMFTACATKILDKKYVLSFVE